MEEKYIDFVMRHLSEESVDKELLMKRYSQLIEDNCLIHLLDVAASGMSAEAGEFMEVIKKIKFQGKPWTDDIQYHLKRELGDILFYVAVGCRALGVDMDEIIEMNKDKLTIRYPEGGFTVKHSENRVVGDV